MQINSSSTPDSAIRQFEIMPPSGRPASAAVERPRAGARYSNPLECAPPYNSMKRLAQLLALRFDMIRTRHSWYRAMRLLHENFGCDPAAITEDQLRDCILHVKTRKLWKPKTVRQTAAEPFKSVGMSCCSSHYSGWRQVWRAWARGGLSTGGAAGAQRKQAKPTLRQ